MTDVKRVRTLYDNTCSQILQIRNEIVSQRESALNSTAAFNEWVDQLEERNGEDWCRQRCLVRFPESFLFTVVMPVFNESQTIAAMIERVCQVDLPMELIVVDDGSTDGTTDVLHQLENENSESVSSFGTIQKKFLFHEVNQGKGAALKTGFKAASGNVIGIQDADQEYDPQEFVALLSTLLLDEADVVYGSRFAAGNKTNSPGWHRFGNGLITWFSNLMTGLNVTDAETCYKLMRKSFLDEIVDGLKEKRFGIELEMTAKLAKNKSIRFDERPISYDKRTYAEGKKIGIRDGFRALWCILKY